MRKPAELSPPVPGFGIDRALPMVVQLGQQEESKLHYRLLAGRTGPEKGIACLDGLEGIQTMNMQGIWANHNHNSVESYLSLN